MYMNIKITSIWCCCILLFTSVHLSAQNKDIEKGKEKLKEAFKQKDQTKKGEDIQKATELLQKGGLKTQAINAILGDAYLEEGDLTHAEAKFGQCDKEGKADGYGRVAAAYVDQAMSADAKNEPKLLDKAMKDYTKAGKFKEGASAIGDKYYEKGEAFYNKAVDYYFKGADTPAVIKIARDYENKGADGVTPAFDLYKRAGLFKKAGDLAWSSKQYAKAYDAYSAGEITEGMRKCADKFYSLGQESEAQNIYIKMVETYTKTANTDAIEKLATENVNVMNYALAARIYDKAGNLNQAKKYYAYDKVMSLDIDSAKILLTESDQTSLAKSIDANKKLLTPLRDVKMQFDDWAKQQPNVGIEMDPETNQYKPVAKDEQMLVDYYKLIKDQISDQCQIISKNVTAIKDPILKRMIMKKFLSYPAVGRILDKETFAVKLTRGSTQVKDVYLKHL
jgi:tetratricopeptide (TPR) repeat protein